MKKYVLAVTVLTMVLGTKTVFAQQLKIGVVDIQEVVDSIDDGKKAQQEFKKIFEEKNKDLEDKAKSLKKQAEGLEGQKLVLSAQAFEDKRKDVETKRNDLMQQQMNYQMELQKKELDLKGKLFTKVRAVVEKVGKDGGYTVVLEKAEGGVFYYPASIDLTKKVVEDYGKAYPKK